MLHPLHHVPVPPVSPDLVATVCPGDCCFIVDKLVTQHSRKLENTSQFFSVADIRKLLVSVFRTVIVTHNESWNISFVLIILLLTSPRSDKQDDPSKNTNIVEDAGTSSIYPTMAEWQTYLIKTDLLSVLRLSDPVRLLHVETETRGGDWWEAGRI